MLLLSAVPGATLIEIFLSTNRQSDFMQFQILPDPLPVDARCAAAAAAAVGGGAW